MRAAWIEISLSAIRKNVSNLKAKTADSAAMMGIIKADAYGHGALQVAQVLRQEGIDRFGVAIVPEGIELRQNGAVEPILILGYTTEEDYAQAIRHDLTLTVYEFEQAIKINQIAQAMGKKATIHIKVDSGMGRLGYQPTHESVDEIKKIFELKNIIPEGIFSHFAMADAPECGYSETQFDRFQDMLEMLEQKDCKFAIKHIANSAATICFQDMHLDMVRPGIALYGQYPDAQMAINPSIELKPAMTIKARLAHVKQVCANTPLSYGCTYETKTDAIVGTIPMGYADGIFRGLSNKGEVLVQGKRCPIVGRVCMDQFMIDLTGLENVKVNDEVVFMGAQGHDAITADEIAAKIGTINYEVVTRMGKRMPRVYVA